MANYSAEEIRAFKLKDILNSRMSALKAAATNNEGLGKAKEEIQEEADYYFEKLRQDQGIVSKPSKESDVVLNNQQLPEPTLAQKKVLDAIAGKQNKTQVDPQLKADVLRWAEETHGQRAYPTKLGSVETFLKWFNK